MSEVRSFPNVPLVGQPLVVLGWSCVVLVKHNCDNPQVVQLVLKQSQIGRQADLGICPGCGQGLSVAALQMKDDGMLLFGIGLTDGAQLAAGSKSAS